MKIYKLLVICLFIAFNYSCSENESSNGFDACGYTIANGETEGTVPTSLHGEYKLTLDLSTNNYKISKGTLGTFTIEAKKLIVEIDNIENIILSTPVVNANGMEYSFTDSCKENVVYTISETSSGDLNEINVSSLTGTFYGQFN